MLVKYPDIINNNAARLTALFTVIMATLTAAFPPSQYLWSSILLGFLTITFFLRSALSPQVEPIAVLANKVLVPLLRIRNVPTNAIPKRFAQTIGLLFCVVGVVFFFLGYELAYQITFGILGFFALLESLLGFCAGCFMFNQMMQWGIFPDSVCAECNDISERIQKLSQQK